jgi:hypothetical protein
MPSNAPAGQRAIMSSRLSLTRLGNETIIITGLYTKTHIFKLQSKKKHIFMMMMMTKNIKNDCTYEIQSFV